MSLILKMGLKLKRIYAKFLRKLNSLKDTPQRIAAGFATGVAVSFTPFVGFHALMGMAVAKISGQNGIAAVLGTIAGNPWTFPLIWYAVLHTGIWILGADAPAQPVDFAKLFSKIFYAVINLDFSTFLDDIWPVFLPLLAGCIPWCFLVWYGVFFLLRHLLTAVPEQNGDKESDIRTGL